MIKEDDMSGVLPSNALTDRAVAGVAVNGPVIRMSMNMVTSSGMFMGHGVLPILVDVNGG